MSIIKLIVSNASLNKFMINKSFCDRQLYNSSILWEIARKSFQAKLADWFGIVYCVL